MLILYFAPGASSMAVHIALMINRPAVRTTIEIEQAIGYELPK
jgi:hypothetical protein